MTGARLKIVLLAGLLTLFIGAACDDDCPTCPSPEGPDKMVVSGDIFLSGHFLLFEYWVRATVGDTLPLDSVVVDSDGAWRRYDTVRATQSPLATNYIRQDTALTAGDTVVIRFYNPGDSAVCEVDLLDYNGDTVLFADLDTVALNTGFEVSWNAIDYAEAYAYEVVHMFDSAGLQVVRSSGYQADTVIAIAGADNAHNGQWLFRVMALSVPETTQYGGSFRFSAYVTGTIVSHAGWCTQRVYAGTGETGTGEAAKLPPPDFTGKDFSELAALKLNR
ncbi:MAG: hypothetical protein JSW34_04600 [Candidatus Zixiibacteriota bacterium]|nr:MAG: hypothetical protein JSW34_04600 [candidate division Zixibacteria bacterium]